MDELARFPLPDYHGFQQPGWVKTFLCQASVTSRGNNRNDDLNVFVQQSYAKGKSSAARNAYYSSFTQSITWQMKSSQNVDRVGEAVSKEVNTEESAFSKRRKTETETG
ncbi:unnamed protein product [Arabidopsis arenosa]|uniref:Uncharacterized protein n=1 Tax=Arabidopsis arenosa TaxID=38785 RepID=A0A8S2AZI8_ARAAE|nr:unnamed protein product [Arabidopsis arenosa]